MPTFADVNVAWLAEVLVAAALAEPKDGERWARAIYAAVAGAQLISRSRSDVALFDELIESYRTAGVLPARTVTLRTREEQSHRVLGIPE